MTSPAGASVAEHPPAAGAGASAAAPGSGSVIVSAPPEGATVDGPVWLVLRDTDGAVSLQVNGQSQVLPPPSTDGLVSILIGPGQDLEPGANVLRVSDSDGAGTVVTRRFAVSRALPVAGAADVTVAAGDPVCWTLVRLGGWQVAGGWGTGGTWWLRRRATACRAARSAAGWS